MTAAALIRESLGRVTPTARQVTVDAVVDGFAKQLAGLEVAPPRRPEDVARRLFRALLWGQEAFTRAQRADAYADVTRDLARVLKALTDEVLERTRG